MLNLAESNFQPIGDRVIVQRIPDHASWLWTPKPAGNEALIVKGKVLAVGQGKWIPGEWWKVDPSKEFGVGTIFEVNSAGMWVWFPGHRQSPSVHPGQLVMFNARWNDFAHAEHKGTDCDGKGPVERPLPLWAVPTLHLIQEADIAGILE